MIGWAHTCGSHGDLVVYTRMVDFGFDGQLRNAPDGLVTFCSIVVRRRWLLRSVDAVGVASMVDNLLANSNLFSQLLYTFRTMSILASIERFESGSVGAGFDAQSFTDAPLRSAAQRATAAQQRVQASVHAARRIHLRARRIHSKRGAPDSPQGAPDSLKGAGFTCTCEPTSWTPATSTPSRWSRMPSRPPPRKSRTSIPRV